jgi:hypothetical protein
MRCGLASPRFCQPVAHWNRPHAATESGVDFTADSRREQAFSGTKIIRRPCRCPYGFAYGPAYGQVGERRKIATHLSFRVYFCPSFRIGDVFASMAATILQIVAGHSVAANGVRQITGATPVFVAVSRHKHLFLAPIVAVGVARASRAIRICLFLNGSQHFPFARNRSRV